jgi:hypothetical protein
MALALETTGGLVVSLGSANPTGAAWLQQSIWNAEANLCLTGVGAARAISTLGLDRLAYAPSRPTSPLERTKVGDKAALVEPAGARGQEKKVLLKFVSVLDLDRHALGPLQRAS